MSRFWNLKKYRLFKQSTAIIVAGALLCSTLLPPFASAKSAESYHLRKALLSTLSKESQTEVLETYQSPTFEKQTLEQGIEFFQKLFKRMDVPEWMDPLVKIVYTPFLSAETWKLEIFDKNFIQDHNPVSLEVLHQLKRDLHRLYFVIGISFIYFYHSFYNLFNSYIGLGPVSSTITTFILSMPISLFGIKAIIHSIINSYRIKRGEPTLTKSNIQNDQNTPNVIKVQITKHGEIFINNKLLVTFRSHAGETAFITMAKGINETNQNIFYPISIEFEDGSTETFSRVYNDNNELIYTYLRFLTPEKLIHFITRYKQLTISQIPLSKIGQLSFGGQTWANFGKSFSEDRVTVEIGPGIDENGNLTAYPTHVQFSNGSRIPFVQVYNSNGEVVFTYYERLYQSTIDKLIQKHRKLILEQFLLDKKGVVSICAKNWAVFGPDHSEERVRLDLEWGIDNSGEITAYPAHIEFKDGSIREFEQVLTVKGEIVYTYNERLSSKILSDLTQHHKKLVLPHIILDNNGQLSFGGENWVKLGPAYVGQRVKVETDLGIDSKKIIKAYPTAIIFENGEVRHFVQIRNSQNQLVGVYLTALFPQLINNLICDHSPLTLTHFRLDNTGCLSFSGKTWAHFGQHRANEKVTVLLKKGVNEDGKITAYPVKIKFEDGTEQTFVLIKNSNGDIIHTTLGTLYMNTLNPLIVSNKKLIIVNFKLDNNGTLTFGGNQWAHLKHHNDEEVKIEIEEGVDQEGNPIVYPVSIEFSDGVKENFIWIESQGQLIHSYYNQLSAERLQELIQRHQTLTFENLKLDATGNLFFGGISWLKLENHRNKQVKIEIKRGIDNNENNIPILNSIEFPNGIKKIFNQFRNRQGQLVFSYNEQLSSNTFQELIQFHKNLTLGNYKLNKKGGLFFAGKYWAGFLARRYGEVEVDINSQGEIDVVRHVWIEKVGEEEKRIVSRLEPFFGRSQRKLFVHEILFRDQLKVGLGSADLSGYEEVIADTLVRLKGKSIHLLKEYGLLTELEIKAIDDLEISTIDIPSLSQRLEHQILDYRSHNLNDSQIHLLISTHLLPWPFIEYLQRTYRLGRSMDLILYALNHNIVNVEAYVKRIREAQEGRGSLDRKKHLKKYTLTGMSVLSQEERGELLQSLELREKVLKALREQLGLNYSMLRREGDSSIIHVPKKGRIELRVGERVKVESTGGNGSNNGYGHYYEIRELNRSEDRGGWFVRLGETRDGSSIADLPQNGYIAKGDLPIKLAIEAVSKVINKMKRTGNRSTGSNLFDRLFGLLPLTASEEGKEYVGREEFFNRRIPYKKISDFESVGDQSQEEAVKLAMNPTEVLFIEGPAGTGKTTVIAEIVRQAIKRGEKVLLVSQMHQAVDNAISILMDDETIPVVRLGSDPTKLSYGVEKVWLGNKNTGMREDVASEFGRRRKALQSKGLDAYLYASTDIGIGTDPMFRKIIGQGASKLFDIIIMDEASRETLTEALVPLEYLKDDGKVIFVGDEKQLPPFGLSTEERALLESGISQEEIQSYNQSVFEWLLKKSYGDRVILSTNYRSHPLIAGVVSHLFYEGDVNRRGWEDFDASTLNLKVIDLYEEPGVYYEEKNEDGSYSNTRSIEEVLKLVEGYQKKGTDLREITILSPYLSQNGRILAALRAKYTILKEEELPLVKTIDGYQGGENKAIIFDFVRSNKDRKIGFVKDLRRLNVGLSRAQENLAIVWDSRTFTGKVTDKDSPEDAKARELFDELDRYYTEEIQTFFPESDEIEEENGIGGIIPIVKEWAFSNPWVTRHFPNLSNRTYDLKIAPALENILAYTFGGIVVLALNTIASNLFPASFTLFNTITWTFFFVAHFIPNSKGVRSPPTNLFLAGMISFINFSLPYLLPHMFAIAPSLVIPTSIVGSFITHSIVNILGNYYKELNAQKSSNKVLNDVLKIRKFLDEHPLSNLSFALTHKTPLQGKVKEKKQIILIQLDQLVKEDGNTIKAEMKLRKVLEGARDRLIGEQSCHILFGFTMESNKLESIVKTLLQEYGIPKEQVLFSVRTQEEAIKKSKGYKIAYVVTAFLTIWRKYAKNILNLGEKLTISGSFARELKRMMNELGFETDNGIDWNWIKEELTIQKKNLKLEDLENLRTSETFQIQS